MDVDAAPSLPATYPNLAALFGAKNAIAQKAASTRKLNKEAKARGLVVRCRAADGESLTAR